MVRDNSVAQHRQATPERAGRLVIDGVAKSYGERLAMRDVSLTVEPGEFVTLLGPSGSGKSTLLMSIAGFVEPEKGVIELDGKSLSGVRPEKRGLGVVFQNYGLFPHQTVRENISFPLEVRRMPLPQRQDMVEQNLEMVELSDHADKYVGQLSGGEQQRVALARALVYRPSVLLMDEPLGALDKRLRTHLQREIRELQQRLGITVVYVTHDQDEALTMSDRIAIMHNGQLDQVGTPRQVYQEPVTEFVADFMGDTNILRGRSERVNGRAVVRLTGGQLVDGDVLAEGTAQTAVIRPEDLFMVPVDEAKEGWTGKVARIVYSGDLSHHHIQLDDSAMTLLLVKVLSARSERWNEGDRVGLRFEPESLRLVR